MRQILCSGYRRRQDRKECCVTRQKRLRGGTATSVQHCDGQEFQIVCCLGSIRQHMYAIKSKFKNSPSKRLYLQFLQPNKSILIHTSPVYVLGTTLTYRAANGGANQFATMVLLSLFPIKCCVKNQEHVIKNVSGDKQGKQN